MVIEMTRTKQIGFFFIYLLIQTVGNVRDDTFHKEKTFCCIVHYCVKTQKAFSIRKMNFFLKKGGELEKEPQWKYLFVE